jgi:hypothetical protein
LNSGWITVESMIASSTRKITEVARKRTTRDMDAPAGGVGRRIT